MNKKVLGFLFCAGLGFLYFANLKKAGVFSWDSAYYSNEAESGWQMLIRADDFLSRRKSLQQIKSEIKENGGGIFPSGIAKPTFIWLLVLFHGVTSTDGVSVTFLSALFGLLTVWMVFVTGRALAGPPVGALSAAIVGLSPLHIYLSRSGFPNGMAAFFFLAGIYLIMESRHFAAGLCLGLAYTSHYGLLPNFLIFGMSLLGLDIACKVPVREAGKKWGLLISGFMVLPVFWETCYRIIEKAAGPSLADTDFHKYGYYIVRQLYSNLPLSSGQHAQFKFSFYPKLYWMGQGIVFIALLGSAVVYWCTTLPVRFKDRGFVLILAQGLVLPVLWVVSPGAAVTRVIEFFLPFQALMIGYFLASFKNEAVKMTLTIVLLLTFLPLAWKPIGRQSGYREGADFLKTVTKEKALIFSSSPRWRLVLGPGKVWNVTGPETRGNFSAAVRQGVIRYAAFDYKDLYALKGEPRAFMIDVRSHLKPAAVIPNAMACDPLNVYDDIDLTRLPNPNNACFIEIYDLRAMVAPGAPFRSPQTS